MHECKFNNAVILVIIQPVFKLATTFGCMEIGTQKIKKQFFPKIKAHVHYVTVFAYLVLYPHLLLMSAQSQF